MRKPLQTKEYLSVPRTRIIRSLRLGGLVAKIGTDILLSASKRLMSGKRSQLSQLLTTENNITRITTELSKMRGAVLKVAQLISLEADEFLPPEAANVLARVRNQSYSMPPKQLKKVLINNWGSNFLKKFTYFEVSPIASASIGQVHKCRTIKGEHIAIKVQYPGIKKSIDSDIKNLRYLLSKTDLTPPSIDIPKLLEVARVQLHKETDYNQERKAVELFSNFLENNPNFVVPNIYRSLCTKQILAMEFMDGMTIDRTEDLSQEDRNKIIHDLISLVLKELFEIGHMQTDPNYANFLFNKQSKAIILLDFGAVTSISLETKNKFKVLLKSIHLNDPAKIWNALFDLKLLDRDLPENLTKQLLDIIEEAITPLKSSAFYDFGDTKIVNQMYELSYEFFKHRKNIKIPDIETLLIQRKIGGIFLLARKLRAKLDVNPIIKKYVE